MTIDTTNETTFAELIVQLVNGNSIPTLTITTPREGEHFAVVSLVDRIVRTMVADALETTHNDRSWTDAQKVRLLCDTVAQLLVRQVSATREDVLSS